MKIEKGAQGARVIRILEKENYYNRLIEINNNENFKKTKDNYNDLNEKYNYLKNENIKIINEFNNIKKQKNTTNINLVNSFCILNQESENKRLKWRVLR